MDYIYGKLSGVPSINELMDRVDTVEQEVNGLSDEVNDLSDEVGTYNDRITNLETNYESLNNKLNGKQDKLTEENAGENIEITTDPETGKVKINATTKNYNIGDGLNLDEDTNTISVDDVENLKYGKEEKLVYPEPETLVEDTDYLLKLDMGFDSEESLNDLSVIFNYVMQQGYHSRDLILYDNSASLLGGDLQLISEPIAVPNDPVEQVNNSDLYTKCLISFASQGDKYSPEYHQYFTFQFYNKTYWYDICSTNMETRETKWLNRWIEINYNNGGSFPSFPKGISNSGTKGGDLPAPDINVDLPSITTLITSQEDLPLFTYNEYALLPIRSRNSDNSIPTEVINALKNLLIKMSYVNDPSPVEEEITTKEKIDGFKDWTYETEIIEEIPLHTNLLASINWDKLYQSIGRYFEDDVYKNYNDDISIHIETGLTDTNNINYNEIIVYNMKEDKDLYTIYGLDPYYWSGAPSGYELPTYITVDGTQIKLNQWFYYDDSHNIVYVVDNEGMSDYPHDIDIYKQAILPKDEYYNYNEIMQTLVSTNTKQKPKKVKEFIDSLGYITDYPNADNDSGRLIVVLVDNDILNDEYFTKYDGYLYIGVEGLALQQQNSTNPIHIVDDGQISYEP